MLPSWVQASNEPEEPPGVEEDEDVAASEAGRRVTLPPL
jgi:hypothetical protein